MKVRQAKKSEKELIHRWWKELFAEDDDGFTDYYFRNLYQQDQSFVLADENDQLVSCLQLHERVIILNGKAIKAGYIIGVFTVPEQQKKGYMAELMKQCLELCDHRYLLTYIQSYVPGIYQAYGYEAFITHRQWQLSPDSIPKIPVSDIRTDANPEELLALYREFSSRFTAVTQRNISYYQNFIREKAACSTQILSAYHQGKLDAYVCVDHYHNRIQIDEAIYLNARSLIGILSALKAENKPITLSASSHEKLERLFMNSSTEPQVYAYARIAQPELLSSLFGLNINSVQKLLESLTKPSWFNEIY